MIDIKELNKKEVAKYKKLGDEEYTRRALNDTADRTEKWYIDRAKHLRDLYAKEIIGYEEFRMRMENIPNQFQ